MQSLDFGKVTEKAFSVLFSNARDFLILALIASLPSILMALSPSTSIVMALAFLSYLWACILQGAVCHLAWRRIEGQPGGFVESLGFAMSRAIPLGVTYLLNIIWVMVGFLLLIIPGILWAVHMLLGTVAVIIEGRSGSDALRRSKELVYVHRSKFANVAIGLPILLCIPLFACSLAGASLMSAAGSGYQIYSLVTQVLTGFFFQSFNIALVVLFLGLRERQEGIEEKSDDIGFTPFSQG